MDLFLEFGISNKREVVSLGLTYHVGQSCKGQTTSLTLNTRRISNKNKKTSTVDTEYSYQDIVKIPEKFKSTPSKIFWYINKHNNKKTK